MAPTEAKQLLHDAIQESVQSTESVAGGLLVKWVVLAEFALPDNRMATARLTGDASGFELRSNEASGLLFEALFRRP